MTDTLVRSESSVRPLGIAAVVAGVVVAGLGVVGAVAPALVGATWFAAVVPAGLLFAAGIVGLLRLARSAGATRLVTASLGVATAAMVVFALAHAYALVDEDTAIALFSVFMVLTAAGLVVAAIGALVTGTPGFPRWTVLAAGVWPLATIPAGAALGDLLHFGAITVWGLIWIAVGAALVRERGRTHVPGADRA